jgi:predicted  nucleic acid-binding Zn-ribbon protein
MSRRTFHIPDTTRTELTQQAPDTTANFALQYQTQVVEQTKAKQQDEMELLSLQRELRIRNREYVAIQSKYDQLFNHFKNIRDNHKTLLTHLEELKQQIEEVNIILR